jgi:uncharacterized protein YjbI with pentapeptide repeats
MHKKYYWGILAAIFFTLTWTSFTSAFTYPFSYIYKWEWVDPDDLSKGKQKSIFLCPDGHVNAEPGVDLSNRNLTQAWLCNFDLSNASMRNTNLTDAYVKGVSVANADFTDAIITGVDFSFNFSFTASQLYTTANYKNGNLSGIDLGNMNLADADFAGKNLTGAGFTFANLTNANFNDAIISNANFTGTTSKGFTQNQFYRTASYKSGDLSGINLGGKNDLTGWNFAGKNLTDAQFGNYLYAGGILTNANFTDAIINGANFIGTTGFTAAQLCQTASYKNGDLSGVGLGVIDLTGCSFMGKNLTQTQFYQTNLTNINFTNTLIAGASFDKVQNFTKTQFYSTASYKNGNLSGISFGTQTNLTEWNLAGKNVSGAGFYGCTLTNTDFSNADLTNSTFDYNFLVQDNLLMDGVNFNHSNLNKAKISNALLANANFHNANLTGASFNKVTLTNADFTDAVVQGVSFDNALDFTADQLYSTASYKTGNLSRILLWHINLAGWNFTDQNITNGNFSSNTMNNTNFTRADLRGASGIDLSTAITTNAILRDGQIKGLNLVSNEILKICDYNQDRSGRVIEIPIQIQNKMTMASDAMLKFIFTDADWGSTISFATGIPVALNGCLDLTFTEDVNPADFLGVTFDLFNWNGVTPTGQFASIRSAPGLKWNIDNLYTTGDVTLVGLPEPTTLVCLFFGGLTLLRRQNNWSKNEDLRLINFVRRRCRSLGRSYNDWQ